MVKLIENCLQVSTFCLCGVIFAVLLKQHCREQSLLLALGVCVAVISAAAIFIAPLIDELRDIFSQAGISEGYISLIFKAAAICIITQITVSICKDGGETAIGSAAEIWGRGAMTLISLPLIKAVMERINEMF